MLKSNKIFRYSFIFFTGGLFVFIATKAYDEYLFQINNRSLKTISFDGKDHKLVPEKSINQNEEVEKIISDFVSDNKYDLEHSDTQHTKPKVISKNQEKQKKIIKNEEKIINVKEDISNSKESLIQLGAFSNKENISSHVKKLKSTFPNLIKDKKFFVKNAKQSLYKLFVGPFSNPSNAKDFCSNLRKNGVSCFFVQM
ncbi:MAG: SPOR domain-containing protein [Rickettsiales bacterium]|nr:SPOR domain-containing protein [Rickettsiales bacterium]